MSKFEADIVWGCAVAVDKFNGGYVKDDQWVTKPDTGETVVTHRPNKVLLKQMLAGKDFHNVTDEDIAEGQALRHHFNGYLLKELSGKINDFERSVLRIAQMDEFNHRNLLEFAIISCLPNSYRRELKHQAYQQAIVESIPLEGEVGDTVQGELIIEKCYYNDNYERHRIVGRFGEAFVDFWFREALEVGSTHKFRGKIKQHRPDNTTQLNYVKKLKE